MSKLGKLLAIAGGGALLASVPGISSAAAAGSDLVAVVIDFGSGGHAPIVECVHDAGQSDAQAITDALNAVGAQGPTFNASGLMCSVANFPSSGCGVKDAQGRYAYWAYFTGSSSGWTYANFGPVSHEASSRTSVGLRFQAQGTGYASDAAPRLSADPIAECPSIASAQSDPQAPQTLPVQRGNSVASVTTSTIGSSVGTSSKGKVASSASPSTTGHLVAAASTTRSASSSQGGLVGTGVLIGLLGAAAAVLVRRRKRAA